MPLIRNTKKIKTGDEVVVKAVNASEAKPAGKRELNQPNAAETPTKAPKSSAKGSAKGKAGKSARGRGGKTNVGRG